MTAPAQNSSAGSFPPPSLDLYFHIDPNPRGRPEEQAAQRILALAHRPLSRWQRLGWRLDPLGRVGRLLYFHRQALDEERAGRADRADCWWEEVASALRRLPREDAAWQEASKLAPNSSWAADPEALRLALVREVLLDTHSAFAAGEPSRTAARVSRHHDHLRAVCRAARLADDERIAWLEPATRAHIKYLVERALSFPCALQAAHRLYVEHPGCKRLQDLLVELRARAALSEVPPSNGKDENRIHAKLLQRHLSALERLRRKHADNIDVYNALGHLYQTQAVKFAHAVRPSRALLAVEKALACKPDWNDAIELKASIRELLQTIQVKVREIESSLGRHYLGGNAYRDVSLNAEGKALQAEANAGSRAAEAWRQSSAARHFSAARDRARARSFWLRVGLPVPERDWDLRAAAFDVATDLLVARKPKSAAAVVEVWSDIVAERRDLPLADIDPAMVFKFFLRQQDKSADSSAEPERQRLTPAPDAGRPAAVPVDHWLVSRRDPLLKLAAVAAGLFLLVTGAATLMDRSRSAKRDVAYAALREAAAQLDEDAATTAAGRFLAAQWPLRPDPRTEEVYKTEAAARDFAVLRRRHALRAELHEAMARQDDRAALDAAERYLASPAPNATDADEPEVRAAYESTLVRWFAQRSRPLDEETRALLARAGARLAAAGK